MKGSSMFPKIQGRLSFGEPLSAHSTFRIGGKGEAWVEPSCQGDLREILKFAQRERKKILAIGKGSNILFRDRGFKGILVHLGAEGFGKFNIDGTKITAGAGMMLGKLINLAVGEGLSGMEGLVGIPGTLGGAIFMNSGYRGNVSDCLDEVKVMDMERGGTRIIKRKDIKFGYRTSGSLSPYIILEATLSLKKGERKALMRRKNNLLSIKRKKHPLDGFSAGCIFRNPARGFSAARYIEMSRLKGRRIGDAKISEKHANFIVNLKAASGNDVLKLIELVKKRVKLQFGVKLTPEIMIV